MHGVQLDSLGAKTFGSFPLYNNKAQTSQDTYPTLFLNHLHPDPKYIISCVQTVLSWPALRFFQISILLMVFCQRI